MTFPTATSSLAFAAAATAAVAIPERSVGLNFLVTGVLVLLAVTSSIKDGLAGFDRTLVIGAALLLGSVVIRATEWVAILNLLGALCLLSIASARARQWSTLVMTIPDFLVAAPRGLLVALGPITRGLRSWGGPQLRTAARGTILAGVLLLSFGALFLSADPAFAALTERYLLPGWDLGSLPVRLFVAAATLGITGGLVMLSPGFTGSEVAMNQRERPRIGAAFGPGEWKVALGLIDLLFAGFVAVQVTVLFAGNDHVLRTTGLTYSQYAREGFFQLLVVAFLTLLVITVAVRSDASEEGTRWMRVFLGPLCILTLVILASSMKRMDLYQEAYGFTRLRLLVDTTIVWLFGVFCLVLVAGFGWRSDWLPRAVVLLSVVALIGLNLYDPDARIAERNIARYNSTGSIDVDYLSHLSADAVPALLSLPEPLRACVLSGMDRHPGRLSFWEWNLARERAAVLLRSVPTAGDGSIPPDDCATGGSI